PSPSSVRSRHSRCSNSSLGEGQRGLRTAQDDTLGAGHRLDRLPAELEAEFEPLDEAIPKERIPGRVGGDAFAGFRKPVDGVREIPEELTGLRHVVYPEAESSSGIATRSASRRNASLVRRKSTRSKVRSVGSASRSDLSLASRSRSTGSGPSRATSTSEPGSAVPAASEPTIHTRCTRGSRWRPTTRAIARCSAGP